MCTVSCSISMKQLQYSDLALPRVGGELLQNHEMLNLVAGKALKWKV